MKPMGMLPPEFAGQTGLLSIGGRSAEALVGEAGDTPLFVYDMAIVAARIAFQMLQLHVSYQCPAH